MRFYLLLAAALLAPCAASAQKAGDKLPPANPLPYTDDESAAVMAPIAAALKALQTNDGAAVLANTRSEGGATVALEGDTRGIHHLSWAEFAAGLKPDGNRYEERIFEPAIEVDGDIAMVWSRFTVLKNGSIQHCGYDHFDLVRENGQWKILNVTWSQRTTGCSAQ